MLMNFFFIIFDCCLLLCSTYDYCLHVYPYFQLSTLSECDFEPPEESYEQHSISKGSVLPTSGGTEILLGDQSLRDNR